MYTCSKARENLASLLDKAVAAGEVRIKRRDGQVFVSRPEKTKASPLDVSGIDLDLSAEEIVAFIGEGRRHQFRYGEVEK